jgi:TatD DNase family protein
VVLHCFTGDAETAREASRRGYFVSFAGNVTYPNADRIRAAAAAVEKGRLVVETDSPFLPPQSNRGASNTPANVVEVLGAVANVRGLNLDVMVAQSTEAAVSAFGLPR